MSDVDVIRHGMARRLFCWGKPERRHMSRKGGIRKLSLRESHDVAWRFLRHFSWKLDMCGVVCNVGPNGEPVACAYKSNHAGNHSWASIPTFASGTSVQP